MLYVIAKAWVGRSRFFADYFLADSQGEFRKGYEKAVVSFSYSWSKGLREKGGVGTVAEAELVPWISVWWSTGESRRDAWYLEPGIWEK